MGTKLTDEQIANLKCERCEGQRPRYRRRFCDACFPLVEAERCRAKSKKQGETKRDNRPRGKCSVCDALKPPGRTTYCSDACAGIGFNRQQDARNLRRLSSCQRCQGPKERGHGKGVKYCEPCRRIMADATKAAEYERLRRAATGPGHKRRVSKPAPGTKWCARCHSFLPLQSFRPVSATGDKLNAYCVPCNKSYNHERRIKLTYGITYDEYELLLACQDFKCAICGGRPRKNKLSVDHDHKTGEIRGLLCSKCNHRMLGAANDDPSRLRKAADYLEAYGPREVFGEPKFVPGSERAA